MQITNKREPTAPIDEPNPKRQRLESETYDNKFYEICSRLAAGGNVDELREIQEKLKEVKINLEGSSHQKCERKINLVFKLILYPKFTVISERGTQIIESALLAHHSSLIKRMVVNNEEKLDLSEGYSTEVVDMALMYMKYQNVNLLEDKNLFDLIKLADYLQAKKLKEVCKEQLLNFLSHFPFDDLSQLEELVEFYNFTLDHPNFRDIKWKIQDELALSLLDFVEKEEYLLFKRAKSLLKEKMTRILLDFSKTSITNNQLAFFKNLPVSGLSLTNCPHLNSKTLDLLLTFKNHNNFKELYLSGSLITDISRKNLSEFSNLLYLDLLDMPDLLDVDLQFFPPSLKELSFFNTPNIGQSKCQHIKRLHQLQKLSFVNCESLNDSTIRELSSLNLKVLSISHNSNIGESSFEYIAKMTSLEELEIKSCENVNDNAIQQLSLNLKILRLSDLSNIGMLSCQHIAKMTELKELYIFDCPHIGEGEIQYISKSLQHCNIFT